MPPETDERPVVNDPSEDWHRMQAVAANNETWGLIEAERTPADDEAMLRAAYASAYHWQRAAGAAPANEVRARYMLAKTHLLAGHPDLSLAYADACLAGCVEADLADFDLAYAHEARARALLALGRRDEGLAAWDLAKAVPIADAEDRAIVDADFADAP